MSRKGDSKRETAIQQNKEKACKQRDPANILGPGTFYFGLFLSGQFPPQSSKLP